MSAVLLLTLVLGADGGAAAVPEPWEFDGLMAKITARAQTKDQLSRMALERLGVQLQGPLQLKVNAHSNSVGGVTLRAEDPSDAKAGCDFYAKVEGELLRFTDSRCTFPAFTGRLQTTATCRKISGTAKKNANGGIDLEAHFPDCNAAPMGVSVSLGGDVVPR
ncbi:MAG: hypothetical protein JNM17_02490 [Archangium sp.]|nr:hypothetical protein [Archangium sp.]